MKGGGRAAATKKSTCVGIGGHYRLRKIQTEKKVAVCAMAVDSDLFSVLIFLNP